MIAAVEEKPQLKPPEPDTLELAFEESKEIIGKQDGWVDAIDQKIVAIFTLASGIAGLVPALSDVTSDVWLWRAGGVAWFVAAVLCVRGFWPSKMSVSPNPDVLYTVRWLAIPTHEYRMKRLSTLGSCYLDNKDFIAKKAEMLRRAMVATAAEIAFFALAIFR